VCLLNELCACGCCLDLFLQYISLLQFHLPCTENGRGEEVHQLVSVLRVGMMYTHLIVLVREDDDVFVVVVTLCDRSTVEVRGKGVGATLLAERGVVKGEDSSELIS